nr:uncharacterized protein LOC124491050 isoform X1 [Dermatophagoides farinae]
MTMNRLILTSTFTMIIFELIMAMGDSTNKFGGPLFVEGSLNDVNKLWKCADVISNRRLFSAAVRGELVNRKMKGDQKIRRFIENCIKWGDGWRFKKDGTSLNFRFPSSSLSMTDYNDNANGSLDAKIESVINDHK